VSRPTYTQQVTPSLWPDIQAPGPQNRGPSRALSFPFVSVKVYGDVRVWPGCPESAMNDDSAAAHLHKSTRIAATASRRRRECRYTAADITLSGSAVSSCATFVT
jgi:hypothetical protein